VSKLEEKDLASKFAHEVAQKKAASTPKKSPSLVNRAQTIIQKTVKAPAAQKKQWLVSGLGLAKAVGASLPGKGATPLGAAFQTLGAIETVRAFLWKTTEDPLAQYVAQYGLEKFTNETFVNIFFNTDLHTKFVLFKVRVGDYRELTDAQGPLGRFAFTKHVFSQEYDATYYMRPEVQMNEVLDGLWTQYSGRLHVNITSTLYGSTKAEFSGFQEIESPLFGNAISRLDQLLVRHERCRESKIPRSYMCYGPPGTGKTSFAMKMAGKIGKRTLKLGAVSLRHISVKDIDYLLRHLAPDFLIIDDVDKIQTGNALPTLLEIVQRFKGGDGHTTLLMTANVITSFDTGFFRPNRIDTWLEFKLPDLHERKEVIRAYAKHQALELSEDKLLLLADESDGLSHDYLREIVSELKRCGSFQEVMELVQLMKSLLLKVVPAKTDKTAKTDEELKKEAAPK
jgi:hypothetical protein